MTIAAEIAAYFKHTYGVDGMKMYKLMYYAQGLALSRRGVALFPEEFQAWRHGPVVREVWNQQGDVAMPALCAEDLALLEDVWRTYGPLTATELSDLTHRDVPWRETRAGLPNHAVSERVIDKQRMTEFYLGRSLVRNKVGAWEHPQPSEADWMEARLQMVVERRTRLGVRQGAEREAFIRDQVVATQRLEGITVTPQQLVHG